MTGLNRSRKRSSCLGLVACTTKPRSIKVSTTGPCGTSMAMTTALAQPATERSQSPALPDQHHYAGILARGRSRRDRRERRPDASLIPRPPQQPRNRFLYHRTLPLLTTHGPSRRVAFPVLALDGATFYWASVVAKPARHMSDSGASSTGVYLVAPGGSACLVSLGQVPPRRHQGTGVYFR